MRIKVDCSAIVRTASAMESAASYQKNKRKEIDSKMGSVSWNGAEYKVFLKKWNEMKNNDKYSGVIVSDLTLYAQKLRFAASIYQSALQSAVQRSKKIPL